MADPGTPILARPQVNSVAPNSYPGGFKRSLKPINNLYILTDIRQESMASDSLLCTHDSAAYGVRLPVGTEVLRGHPPR